MTVPEAALVDAFYREVAGLPPGASAQYPTLADGARAVAMVEAALRSAESATWQPVAAIRSVLKTSPAPGT
jgi:predicted dehydrogenase